MCGQRLLMQVLHRCGAEDDEEPHPEGGALERDGLIRFLVVSFVFGPKDNGIKEQRKKTQHEKQLDHEDYEIFGMVLDPASRLRSNDLIDVMEVHAAGEEKHDQQYAGDLLIVLVKNVRDGFNLFLWNGLLQSRCDGHDEKCQATDPNDRREQMKPVIDDRNQNVEVGRNALKSVHLVSR